MWLQCCLVFLPDIHRTWPIRLFESSNDCRECHSHVVQHLVIIDGNQCWPSSIRLQHIWERDRESCCQFAHFVGSDLNMHLQSIWLFMLVVHVFVHGRTFLYHVCAIINSQLCPSRCTSSMHHHHHHHHAHKVPF